MDFMRGSTAKAYRKAVSRFDYFKSSAMKLVKLVGGDGTKELDIAISAEGKAELLDALREALVNGTTEVLSADGQFKEIIDYVWKGEDKDQFMANFEQTKKNAIDRIEGHYRELENELNKIEREWEEFRASHVSAE